MKTKHSTLQSISDNTYAAILQTIKNHLLEIEQEPFFSAVQRVNLAHWKIGETLSVHKTKSLPIINSLSRDLTVQLPQIMSFSIESLKSSIKFYTTYSRYPLTSQQLKKKHLFELGAGYFISLLLRAIFNSSKPLTNIQLVQRLSVFNLPWKQNLILIQKISDANVTDKLWYAKKAIMWKADDVILKTWINHKLIDNDNSKYNNIACPGNRWFDSYCQHCKGIENGQGISTASIGFWIMLLGIFIISDLFYRLKYNYLNSI